MKTETFNKVFDAMLDEAAADYAADLGKLLEEIDTSDVEFSDRHKHNMEKLFKARRHRQKIISASKHIKQVACVFLVVCICSVAAIGSVEAWRDKVLSYVFDPDSPGTVFDFGSSDGDSYYSEWGISFKYIPTGFSLQQDISQKDLDIMFVNDNDLYFIVTSQSLGDSFGIDTENAVVNELIINGNKALSTSNEKGNIILWYDNNYSYTIYGNISQKEMLKVVENIEII
ncbi:MAG: DUF4367 domain-containing protein, partial [Clostridia bacterium]|nr:DUF4367 domain-containing protein [Clostridia bacterium]